MKSITSLLKEAQAQVAADTDGSSIVAADACCWSEENSEYYWDWICPSCPCMSTTNTLGVQACRRCGEVIVLADDSIGNPVDN